MFCFFKPSYIGGFGFVLTLYNFVALFYRSFWVNISQASSCSVPCRYLWSPRLKKSVGQFVCHLLTWSFSVCSRVTAVCSSSRCILWLWHFLDFAFVFIIYSRHIIRLKRSCLQRALAGKFTNTSALSLITQIRVFPNRIKHILITYH